MCDIHDDVVAASRYYTISILEIIISHPHKNIWIFFQVATTNVA